MWKDVLRVQYDTFTLHYIEEHPKDVLQLLTGSISNLFWLCYDHKSI